MPMVKSGHYSEVVCNQRAKDGWLRMETRIKWPGQLQTDGWHSEYDCLAMPIMKYFETRRVKDRLTMQMSKHGTAVRCKVCSKPAPNANYCCSQCSDENDGNIFGSCGPKSGRVMHPYSPKVNVE